MSAEEANLLEFFKVYIAQHSSERMLIPRQFVDCSGRRKGGLALLTGPSGETWFVRLVKEGGEMYFKDGWKEFAEDHLLREKDFLFFTYGGNLQFSVKIYDEQTKCPKRAAFGAITCSN